MNHTNLHIHTLNIRRAIQHISQPRWWKSRLLTWELFRWVGSRYSLLPHRNCYHVDSLDCYQRRLRRVETVSPSIILTNIKSSSTCLRSTWVEVNTFSHCIFRWGGSGYPLSPHPNIYLVNSFDVHQSRIKCTTRVYRNKTYVNTKTRAVQNMRSALVEVETFCLVTIWMRWQRISVVTLWKSFDVHQRHIDCNYNALTDITHDKYILWAVQHCGNPRCGSQDWSHWNHLDVVIADIRCHLTDIVTMRTVSMFTKVELEDVN